MKRLALLPSLLLLVFPVPGRAQNYTVSATAQSSITLEVSKEGWVVHQRAVRFEPYDAIPDDIKVGVPFAHRLATITSLSDGESDALERRIQVTVDDMSGPALRRIAEFTDPGRQGEVVGGLFFVTTGEGCCGQPNRHHVRNLETGKALFNASGDGEMGMTAFMEVPNHHPTLERWAAFEGLIGDYDKDPAMLGMLRYGDRYHTISAVALRMDPAKQPQDIVLELPSCGALLWREPGKEPGAGQPQRPKAGACSTGGSYAPVALFSLEHASGPLGGFALEISLSGKVYATIPVTGDRLDIAHARLQHGLTLQAVPPNPGG